MPLSVPTSDSTVPLTTAETSAAETSAAETPAGETPVARAIWDSCFTRFECATVEVPLDHDQPSGPTIDIGLIRVPASGKPLGSVFVNLGGPGGSAINSIRNGFSLDDMTMTNYHLVGFDPRGVGRSSPLTCAVDLISAPRPDFSPDSPDELAALDGEAKALADACNSTDASLLPHLDTASVVADLDLLRRSVGDSELHYIGLSYGTLIGLRYAEQFPQLVGRMVLDGVVDPSFTLVDLLRQQAQAFEASFQRLDAECGGTLSCPEGGLIAAFDRLAGSLEQTGPDGGVGTAELEIATLIAMYSNSLWPRYAAALSTAEQGNLDGIERLHDLYMGGISFTAYIAVSCIDSQSPSDPAGWDVLEAELAELAPRFGATLANELRSCAHWPVPASGKPGPVTAAGSKPILVLSTTGDAATPLENAIQVAENLASAGLVVAEDDGHTAYSKSACARQAVSDYFASGVVPSETVVC